MGRNIVVGLVTRPEPETLKIQVPRDLVQNLSELDARLAREAPDMTFDRSAVVANALRAALRKANQTLDARARTGAP